jgi:hypothetical protein
MVFLAGLPLQANAALPEGPLNTLLDHYRQKQDLTDWEAVVLGVNGVKIKTPLFGTSYFKETEKAIRERKGEYRLVTDYVRLVMAYRSHGRNPEEIAGYDFIEKIKQFENMSNQGLNAYTWSLIALKDKAAELAPVLIDNMLEYRTEGGGFSYKRNPGEKDRADIDQTAMAVTALAPYAAPDALRDIGPLGETVRDVVDAALAYLRDSYDAIDNCESAAQVIIAMCSAGQEADETLLEIFNGFRLSDGFYTHTLESNKTDEIATRQAALALTALKRAEEGLGGVYE